jgi:hypothetical protein
MPKLCIKTKNTCQDGYIVGFERFLGWNLFVEDLFFIF